MATLLFFFVQKYSLPVYKFLNINTNYITLHIKVETKFNYQSIILLLVFFLLINFSPSEQQ